MDNNKNNVKNEPGPIRNKIIKDDGIYHPYRRPNTISPQPSTSESPPTAHTSSRSQSLPSRLEPPVAHSVLTPPTTVPQPRGSIPSAHSLRPFHTTVQDRPPAPDSSFLEPQPTTSSGQGGGVHERPIAISNVPANAPRNKKVSKKSIFSDCRQSKCPIRNPFGLQGQTGTIVCGSVSQNAASSKSSFTANETELLLSLLGKVHAETSESGGFNQGDGSSKDSFNAIDNRLFLSLLEKLRQKTKEGTCTVSSVDLSRRHDSERSNVIQELRGPTGRSEDDGAPSVSFNTEPNEALGDIMSSNVVDLSNHLNRAVYDGGPISLCTERKQVPRTSTITRCENTCTPSTSRDSGVAISLCTRVSPRRENRDVDVQPSTSRSTAYLNCDNRDQGAGVVTPVVDGQPSSSRNMAPQAVELTVRDSADQFSNYLTSCLKDLTGKEREDAEIKIFECLSGMKSKIAVEKDKKISATGAASSSKGTCSNVLDSQGVVVKEEPMEVINLDSPPASPLYEAAIPPEPGSAPASISPPTSTTPAPLALSSQRGSDTASPQIATSRSPSTPYRPRSTQPQWPNEQQLPQPAWPPQQPWPSQSSAPMETNNPITAIYTRVCPAGMESLVLHQSRRSQPQPQPAYLPQQQPQPQYLPPQPQPNYLQPRLQPQPNFLPPQPQSLYVPAQAQPQQHYVTPPLQPQSPYLPPQTQQMLHRSAYVQRPRQPAYFENRGQIFQMPPNINENPELLQFMNDPRFLNNEDDMYDEDDPDFMYG